MAHGILADMGAWTLHHPRQWTKLEGAWSLGRGVQPNLTLVSHRLSSYLLRNSQWTNLPRPTNLSNTLSTKVSLGQWVTSRRPLQLEEEILARLKLGSIVFTTSEEWRRAVPHNVPPSIQHFLSVTAFCTLKSTRRRVGPLVSHCNMPGVPSALSSLPGESDESRLSLIKEADHTNELRFTCMVFGASKTIYVKYALLYKENYYKYAQ